jgi:hypothetical protein
MATKADTAKESVDQNKPASEKPVATAATTGQANAPAAAGADPAPNTHIARDLPAEGTAEAGAKADASALAPLVYRIVSTRPSFHCARRRWTSTPEYVPEDELSEEQLDELRASSFMLVDGPMPKPEAL